MWHTFQHHQGPRSFLALCPFERSRFYPRVSEALNLVFWIVVMSWLFGLVDLASLFEERPGPSGQAGINTVPRKKISREIPAREAHWTATVRDRSRLPARTPHESQRQNRWQLASFQAVLHLSLNSATPRKRDSRATIVLRLFEFECYVTSLHCHDRLAFGNFSFGAR